ELTPISHVICLQEIEPSPASDEDTRAGPRRALKVTCAIQFSKSAIKGLFLAEEAGAGTSLRASGSAKTSSGGFIPCSYGNICGRPLAVNPPACRESRCRTRSYQSRPSRSYG